MRRSRGWRAHPVTSAPPNGSKLAVGDRAADLADILAHHYLTALELHVAAGDSEQQVTLQAHAARALGLAGARALVLDVERAERQLARALELAPADAPERATLLENWARALQQQGRLREAGGGARARARDLPCSRGVGHRRPDPHPAGHRARPPRRPEGGGRSPRRRSRCSRDSPSAWSSSPCMRTWPDSRRSLGGRGGGNRGRRPREIPLCPSSACQSPRSRSTSAASRAPASGMRRGSMTLNGRFDWRSSRVWDARRGLSTAT